MSVVSEDTDEVQDHLGGHLNHSNKQSIVTNFKAHTFNKTGVAEDIRIPTDRREAKQNTGEEKGYRGTVCKLNTTNSS